MSSRVGIGYDVHQLVAGETLILGGVTIPHDKGTAGHSDGDVLSHAIADALLGAASLGDIGAYFPSSDETIAGISSLKILRTVTGVLEQEDYRIGNIDTTIILQAPKLASFLPEIKTRLQQVLHITADAMSIKATTTDHLGFTGRGEGIAVMAVALVNR